MLERIWTFIKPPHAEAPKSDAASLDAAMYQLWRDVRHCSESASDIQAALLGVKVLAEQPDKDDEVLSLVPLVWRLGSTIDVAKACLESTTMLERELVELEVIFREVRVAVGQAVSNSLAR